MIERINGIKIKGRCFNADTNLLFYQNANDRLSLVYGKNGSGKSTVSEGIFSISQAVMPSDLSVSFIDSNNNVIPYEGDASVFVFDEKYIDENVKIDDDGLGTIVLLGGQVNLQSEIEKQEYIVNALSDQIEGMETEASKYQDRANPLCPAFHLSRIAALLKKDGGWADADSKIKGNRIKSQVTEAVIKDIGELVVKESDDELRKKYNEAHDLLEKLSDSSISYPNSIEKITIDPEFESTVKSILEQIIEEPVLTEREKLILDAIQKGNQERVEAAQKEFGKEETKICPYCYQPVTDQYKHDLIESINKVLNKDVDEHKAKIAAIQFPDLTLDLSSVESLDALLVKEALQQHEKCISLLKEYQDHASKKAKNTYTPITIEANGLVSEVKKLNQLLEAIEEKRIEFNNATREKESVVRQLISINKAIAHNQISQMYKDYSKQEKEKTSLLQKIANKQNEHTIEREKLKRLQQRKANIGLAIESINNSLDYVFLTKGRLSIELRNEKYYLKSNGADVLPKKVSQGERNIIALCYFFTQILSNQEIGKLYQSEMFVVIDDPISSFDFENKIGITSLIRHQTDRIIKGNKYSKILVFSHDLETVFALRNAFEEICNSMKGNAGMPATSVVTLELRNLKLTNLIKKHNEYGNLLKRIYHYANEENQEEALVVGNEMRRVLEAFSSFTYQKSITKVSCDKNVLSALGNHSLYFENLMYRLALHGESHFEEQIYSIHDGYQFYQFISEDEKIKTAKSILCFIYLLNPYHIIAYLQTEPGAVDTIRQWAGEIPDNSAFEIEEKSSTRFIPLYYLPISAGLGNESFDGIPFENYETDELSCDFALNVSGDSMEPDIPDGSIVLVKKQDIINDGEVGAFFYNGRVYCKYLRHDSGVAFLCSYNEKYQHIAIEEDGELYTYGAVVKVISPQQIS